MKTLAVLGRGALPMIFVTMSALVPFLSAARFVSVSNNAAELLFGEFVFQTGNGWRVFLPHTLASW